MTRISRRAWRVAAVVCGSAMLLMTVVGVLR